MTNSGKFSGVEDKEIVEVTIYPVITYLMLIKDPLQEGWLEISCKNTSPAQLIMRILQSFCFAFDSMDVYHYTHKGGAV